MSRQDKQGRPQGSQGEDNERSAAGSSDGDWSDSRGALQSERPPRQQPQ